MSNPLITSAKSIGNWLLPAIATGILAGLAYPPFDAWWLIWLALVPLLWLVHTRQSTPVLFCAGLVAGTVFFLIINHPGTSAHLWGGWLSGTTPEEHQQVVSRQYIFLKIIWIVFSTWCGLFWGIATAALAVLSRGKLPLMALLAPPLFVIFPEWLRSITLWNYQWGYLGNAIIEAESLRQLGALGGVWLMTWLVVLVNVAIVCALRLYRQPKLWPLPASIALLLILTVAGGSWRINQIQSHALQQTGIRAAAIQYSQQNYSPEDYTSIGLERSYYELIQQVARGDIGEVDLLALPESIAFGVFSLDGSGTSERPEHVQVLLDNWKGPISRLYTPNTPDLTIVVGLDTVEYGQPHNTMVFWNRAGPEAWYHKQRLVPFAEYTPSSFRFFGVRGQSQYTAGKASHVAEVHGVEMGSFICQEVQIPEVIRNSVLNGAELLISGGNDGVFADPAIAESHAKMARLRAVESGRYIVRAMKTGVSALISPTGSELSRSPSAEPYVVVGQVRPLNQLTPYMRLGDWPVVLAFLGLLAGILYRAAKKETTSV